MKRFFAIYQGQGGETWVSTDTFDEDEGIEEVAYATFDRTDANMFFLTLEEAIQLRDSLTLAIESVKE